MTEALPLLEQAASQGGRSGLWCTRLSEAYLFAGRTKDALECVQRALDLSQDGKQRGYQVYALRLLGEITAHHKPSEVEQARAELSTAIELYRAAEIANFVYFVRKRLLQPRAFEEEIQSTLLREELRQLSRDEEAHVEQEFAGYDQLYPRE